MGRNGNQRTAKLEVTVKDISNDIAYLKASYDKINAELGMVNQQIATMRANYEWIKWLTVTITVGVIATVIKVWLV